MFDSLKKVCNQILTRDNAVGQMQAAFIFKRKH